METYEEFINNILETRGRFECGAEYHERHHIIPKCMGGNNSKDNLIDLFAREHFVAHKLLAQENPENDKLTYAWWCMSIQTNEHTKERYSVSAEEYEECKLAYVNKLRDRMSGINSPMYGVSPRDRMSDEAYKKWRQHLKESHPTGPDHPQYGVSPKERMSEEVYKQWLHKQQTRDRYGSSNPNYGNHKLKGKYTGSMGSAYGSGKAVVQLTTNDEFITEYISSYAAQAATGINRGGILQVCHHANNRTIAGGFHWMFKDEYLNIVKDASR